MVNKNNKFETAQFLGIAQPVKESQLYGNVFNLESQQSPARNWEKQEPLRQKYKDPYIQEITQQLAYLEQKQIDNSRSAKILPRMYKLNTDDYEGKPKTPFENYIDKDNERIKNQPRFINPMLKHQMSQSIVNSNYISHKTLEDVVPELTLSLIKDKEKYWKQKNEQLQNHMHAVNMNQEIQLKQWQKEKQVMLDKFNSMLSDTVKKNNNKIEPKPKIIREYQSPQLRKNDIFEKVYEQTFNKKPYPLNLRIPDKQEPSSVKPKISPQKTDHIFQNSPQYKQMAHNKRSSVDTLGIFDDKKVQKLKDHSLQPFISQLIDKNQSLRQSILGPAKGSFLNSINGTSLQPLGGRKVNTKARNDGDDEVMAGGFTYLHGSIDQRGQVKQGYGVVPKYLYQKKLDLDKMLELSDDDINQRDEDQNSIQRNGK